MNLHKKITGLVLVFLFFVFTSGAYAQEALPHFFPEGARKSSPEDAADQWREWLLYYNAARNALANGSAAWPGFIGGKSITLKKTYFGQEISLVFDNYFEDKDKIRYTSFDGQYYITRDQFQVVVDLMDKFVRQAAERQYAYWGPAIKQVKIEVAKSFDKPESDFEAFLGKKTQLNPNITFRELLLIPEDLEVKDFIPYREIHLGLTPAYPSVLGVAWLDVGVVYYTPVAMIHDYLKDWPVVLGHEFVHANRKLQSMPWVWGFDAEVLASVPAMLVESDHLNMWGHSYAEEFREFAWVYGRFDFEQARKENVKVEGGLMGNLIIDEEAFNRNSAKLNEIKLEFTVFFPKVITKLYSKLVWYLALNDRLADDNSVFKLMMAANYNPTVLGGEEESMKWFEANKYEIAQMAARALREMDNDNSQSMLARGNISGLTREQRVPLLLLGAIKDSYGISDDEIKRFLTFHKVTPQEIFNWGPEKLEKAIKDFLKRERLKKEVQ